MYLSKLGVVQENVDDPALAAQVINQHVLAIPPIVSVLHITLQIGFLSFLYQFVASKRAMDAGVVASPRAAQIYGLNVLAERIQV